MGSYAAYAMSTHFFMKSNILPDQYIIKAENNINPVIIYLFFKER